MKDSKRTNDQNFYFPNIKKQMFLFIVIEVREKNYS